MAGTLEEIFENAVELKDAEREAYLRTACGSNTALRAEVDGLLRAHERAAGFMASPTAEHLGAANLPTISPGGPDQARTHEAPGSHIGPYQLLQLIGEGGFGSVFMAEQTAPVQRRVALKIIKLGMDTRQVVARFEQERQALAILDHPSIAKVFDAGATSAGRPYFVMELVKGSPIVEYCDANKLSIVDRLELFAQVCSAVQHAHTKGIIHRDIKPSNILVSTQDGRPHAKVIDFGIAKATASKLTEKTLFTEHRQLIGTPEYMSPEQAEGSLDIDTRTDVYSLGVLLYELLTGTTPFSSGELRSAAYAEIQRIIREVDPPKPSTRLSENTETIASVATLRRSEPKRLGILVRGELDWIVMKALEKDRARRYESASQLAADIRRHLENEPVSAGPPSAGYKLRKLARRHRGKVAAAGLVCAALVLGVVGTTWGMLHALEEKARADQATSKAVAAAEAETRAKESAQRRLAQVEKASDILASVFQSLDPREIARNGRPLQAVLVENLDKAITELDADAIGDSNAVLNVQIKLGKSLLSLGEGAKSIAVLEKARKNATDLLGPDDPLTLTCTNNLAMAYANAGKFDQATSMFRGLIERTKSKPTGAGDDGALAMHNLGLILRQNGKAAEALPLFEEALAHRKASLGPTHPYTLSTQNALATTYSDLKKEDLAIPLFEETLAAYRSTLGAEHPSTLATMNNLGFGYSRTGRMPEALALLEEVVRVCRSTLGTNHPNTLASMTTLGSVYQNARMYDKALPLLEETLTLMRARHGNEHPNTVNTMTTLASGYWNTRQLDKSVPLYEEALSLQARMFGRESAQARRTAADLGVNYKDAGRYADALPLLEEAYRASERDPGLAYTATPLAETYANLGKREQAAPLLAAMIANVRKSQAPDSPALATGLIRPAVLYLKANDPGAAEPLLREALAIREKAAPDDWTTFNVRSLLGETLVAQSRLDDAEPLLLSACEGLEQRAATIPPEAASRIPEAMERLVHLYEARRDTEQTRTWRARMEAAASLTKAPSAP